jgi:4-hydroxybenzoate polyprenyltransferase
LAITAFARYNSWILSIPEKENTFFVYAFILSCTLFYYNFQKISWYNHFFIGDNLTQSKYLWLKKNTGAHVVLLVISYAGICAFSFSFLNYAQLATAAGIAVPCLFYNMGLKSKSIRQTSGIKAFFIGFVIATVTTFLPAFLIPLSKLNFQFLLLTWAGNIFFISALCILSDIRDIAEDTKHNIATFPVMFGHIGARARAALLLLVPLIITFILHQYMGLSFLLFQIRITIFIATCTVIVFLHPQSKSHVFIYAVDGLMLLPWLLIFLHSHLNLK